MVHLERKGWPWGWWRLFTNLNILFFADKKTQGKWQEHRESTGNLVLIGAWQPCLDILPCCILSDQTCQMIPLCVVLMEKEEDGDKIRGFR